jgi:hypothetical protein
MTLPGAETMKAGIRGVDCLFRPLSCACSISSRMPLTVPLVRRDMSTDGEDGELLSGGVCVCRERVLELDLERDCVWTGFPPNDRLAELLVIARRACSQKGGRSRNTLAERSGRPRQSNTGCVGCLVAGWLILCRSYSHLGKPRVNTSLS